MRPMLAEDFVEGKLRFPLGAQPKIDGVRGLNMNGVLTGRSLKVHKNRYTTHFYSHDCVIGMDGELAANSETHPDLCRITSSAVGTISGEPFTLWWLFDYVTFETKGVTYEMRYDELVKRVAAIQYENFDVWQHLRVVPMVICHDQAELDYWEEKWLAEGYEGVIIRDLLAHHKQGRSTVREMGLLRIKRFIESECLVTGITEGKANENEAQTNELGKTFRSSHQENKVPNGMVGHFTGKACQTVKDPSSGKIVINEGDDIIVSPGKMPHDKRKFYFENPGLIVGQVIKFKFFPKGIKDKPRFPTYVSLKIESDI